MEKTLLGYKVKASENPRAKEAGQIGYFLHGPRGAIYALFRTVNNPRFLFPVNGHGNVCALKGNGWFTDESGELDVLNKY